MSSSAPVFSGKQSQEDSCAYPYNGKVLLAAVIVLSVVIAFVILLHVYARWFLRRRPETSAHFFMEPLRRRPSWSAFIGYAMWEAGLTGDGLDPKSVASLPVFVCKSAEHENGQDCVVCLSVMEDGERGRVLPECKHVFHVHCIDAWLMAHSTCPICRAPVLVDQPSSVTADDQIGSVIITVEQSDQSSLGGETEQSVEGDVVEASPRSSSSPNKQLVKEEVHSTPSTSSSVAFCSSSSSTDIDCSLKCILSKSRSANRSRSENRVLPSPILIPVSHSRV